MPYRREYRLSKLLIGISAEEIADESIKGREIIIARMVRALGRQRFLGRTQHWAYNISLHMNLAAYIKDERETIAALEMEDA